MATMDKLNMEQAIASCLNTADEIRMLSEAIVGQKLSKLQISDALIGIEQTHQMRCKKAFDILEGNVSKSRSSEKQMSFLEDSRLCNSLD